jgi:parallel beta-helix repeat protein
LGADGAQGTVFAAGGHMNKSACAIGFAGAVFCSAAAAQARVHVVRSGGSIRAALAQAEAGDTIVVHPGVYREGDPNDLNALTVRLDGIRLVGRPQRGHPVVLENAGMQGYGVWVSPDGSAFPKDAQSNAEKPPCGYDGSRLHGFTIEGFTLRGFRLHGLHLACVQDFRISNNVAEGNHVYGLFPVLSQDGTMTDNVVRGSDKDAGIYVGQSDRVLIAGNHAEDNLLGLEVENSRDCTVIGNELTLNTLGIIVDLNFDKVLLTAERTLVAANRVHDNNRTNTAEPGDLISVLPPGIGILISAADATTVTLNDVQRNNFAGVAVVSICLGLALQGHPELCSALGIEPNPDDNHIVLNRVVGNGTVPTGFPPLDALLGDLVWDGSGTGNCWSHNQFGTSVPSPLSACP